MSNRRRLLMSVIKNKNIMKNAEFVKAMSIATTSVLSGSNVNTWLFMIPIKPNTTYLIRKRQPIGSLFRVGFISDNAVVSGKVVENTTIDTTLTECEKTSPSNGAYLVMTLYSGTAEGDIHTQVAEITEVYEV